MRRGRFPVPPWVGDSRTPGHQSEPGGSGKKMSMPFLLSHQPPGFPRPPPASATLEKHWREREGYLAQGASSSCLTLRRASYITPQIPLSIKWNCSLPGKDTVMENQQSLPQGGTRFPSELSSFETIMPHPWALLLSCHGVPGSQEVFWQVGRKTSHKVPGSSPLE